MNDDQHKFTITLSAPTLEELAELAACIHQGLRSSRKQFEFHLDRAEWTDEDRQALREAKTRTSGYHWTDEQDLTVVRMRMDGKAWWEIAHAIGRTEKAVVLRWQTLKHKDQAH